MTENTSDMAVLFPQGKDVEVGGSTVTVLPFTFGAIPKVSKLLQPILQALLATGFSADPAQLEELSVGDMLQKFLSLLDAEGDAIIDIVALAVKKDRVWFDGISMDEGVQLALAVFEVNRNLVTKKLLPMMEQLRTTSAGVTL